MHIELKNRICSKLTIKTAKRVLPYFSASRYSVAFYTPLKHQKTRCLYCQLKAQSAL